MNAAEDDKGASRPRGLSDPVAAQRIPGVNADADHVAGLDRVVFHPLQRFIDQERCAVPRRRSRREHVLPPGRDDGRTKRHVARIDEVNAHGCPLK